MSSSPRVAPRRRQGRRPPGPSPFWFVGFVALAVGMLWGLTLLGKPTEAPFETLLRFAEMAPQYRLSADGQWNAVEEGHEPIVGEDVRTTDGMCTAIVVGGASSVRLWMDTAVHLESSSRTQGTFGLRLHQGRIWIDADPALTIRVLTPSGAVSVSGGASEVRVERGKVEVIAWRGAARCEGPPSRSVGEAHRLVLGETAPTSVTTRPDVWESWNRRVQSARLVSHVMPGLVPSGALAVQPSSAPSKAPLPPAARPRLPKPSPPLAKPAYPTAAPAVAAPAATPPPAAASVPAPAVVEEISVGPNDPLEKQIADVGTREVMRSVGRLSTDSALIARVDRLGQRIAAQSPRASMKWTFRVLDTSAPNALTVGYGRVYVTRGLLALVDDEELAGALGHEIAHACLRHSERMFDHVGEAATYARKAQEARRQAMAAREEKDAARFEEQVRIYEENLRKANDALERAQSSTDRWDAEYQADRYGMLYVHNAGFRPIGLVDSLEKIRKVTGRQQAASVEGSSTHPPIEERIEIARKVYASYFPGGR